MSHDGQTPSREANVAKAPVARRHIFASILPAYFSPSTPIPPDVRASHHDQPWYPSKEDYPPPKSDFPSCIPWDVEMQLLRDLTPMIILNP